MRLPKLKTMSSQSEIVYLAIFVLCIFESVESYVHKPIILSAGRDDIVEANRDYSVLCQGKKPIAWKTPDVEVDKFNKPWTTFETEAEIPQNTNFKYGLRLYITNMTYKYVGFYYCHYENDDIGKSRIYLYVDDEDHLSVTGSTSPTVPEIYVREYDTALIPCRPTSPSVQVNLVNEEGNVERYNNHYDPFYGFTTNATYEEGRRLYSCTFRRNYWSSEQTMYRLIVELHRDSIAKPQIKDLREGHTMTGEFINLKCELVSNVSVMFSWDIPNKKINKQQIKNTTNGSDTDYLKFSKLEISNVTSADEGVYTCHVFDRQNHTESSSVTMRFFGEGEHQLFIEADSNSTETFVGKKSIVWTASVWGHPEPDYKWVTNQNKEIFPDQEGFIGANAKYSFLMNKHSNMSKFTIRNVSINDFGTYKLIASNEYANKTLEFRLNAIGNGEHELFVEADSNFSRTYAGKHFFEWTIFASGYPEPDFKWVTNENTEIFPDPEGFDGTDAKYSFFLNKNSNVSWFTIRNISINDFGTYKFFANNGYENKTLEFLLEVTDKPHITINLDKEFHRPGEPSKVYCTAKGYPQPVIKWEYMTCWSGNSCDFKEIQGTLIESKGLTVKSQVVITTDDQFSQVKCIATNNEGSDYVLQNIIISEYDDGFEITDFDDTAVVDKNDGSATFATGESIRILCGLSKLKYTEVAWFFGDVELKSNDRITIRIKITEYARNAYLLIQNASSSDIGIYKCTAIDGEESFTKEVKVFVKDPIEPSIHDTKTEKIETNLPNDVKLTNQSSEIPRPETMLYTTPTESPDASDSDYNGKEKFKAIITTEPTTFSMTDLPNKTSTNHQTTSSPRNTTTSLPKAATESSDASDGDYSEEENFKVSADLPVIIPTESTSRMTDSPNETSTNRPTMSLPKTTISNSTDSPSHGNVDIDVYIVQNNTNVYLIVNN